MSKRLYRGISNKPLDELMRIKAELMAEVDLIDMAIGLRKKLDERKNGTADPQECQKELFKESAEELRKSGKMGPSPVPRGAHSETPANS